MSQMTVSQMSITETTASPQHKLHWLAEQALDWSGLPVVHVRPTVFLEGFFLTLTPDSVRESDQIRLPFGEGKTSPVAAEDAGPHNHLSGHSRRAVAGRPAKAGLAGSSGEPPGGVGRSASRGALRPDVGRRAHTDGARAAECAAVRPKECGDIHRIGKSSLSVCGCSHSTNLTFDLHKLHGLKLTFSFA